MPDEQILELVLQVQTPDGDDEEVDNATRRLYSQINDLDVESVNYARTGSIPVGAKSGDPALIGVLVVAVAPIVITKLLDFLHGWCMRNENNTVKIKVQSKSGESIEIEVPAKMSKTEAKDWINVVREKLTSNKK